jgi:glucosamine-6-phosphate deaminase
MSRAAAEHAARTLRSALARRNDVRIVVATGESQLEFLADLSRASGIDWRRVEMFHLDEYVGLPIEHPASFRRYLLERFIKPAGIVRYHLIDGEADAAAAAERAGREIAAGPIDAAFVGIGENGHVAFNDPPADR